MSRFSATVNAIIQGHTQSPDMPAAIATNRNLHICIHNTVLPVLKLAIQPCVETVAARRSQLFCFGCEAEEELQHHPGKGQQTEHEEGPLA